MEKELQSAYQTKTPTGFDYNNICLAEPTHAFIAQAKLSTIARQLNDRSARPGNIRRQQNSLQSMLLRSVESSEQCF
jgi:hypothetical protein